MTFISNGSQFKYFHRSYEEADVGRFRSFDRPGLRLSTAAAGGMRRETRPLFDNLPERL